MRGACEGAAIGAGSLRLCRCFRSRLRWVPCIINGMTKEQILGEASSLSSRDRLELAIELWDTVENEAEFLPLSEGQVAELDRRLDAYIANPSATLPAGEVLDELERDL